MRCATYGIDIKSRKQLLDPLEHDLATEPQPADLDIEPLTGRVPWLRLHRASSLRSHERLTRQKFEH